MKTSERGDARNDRLPWLLLPCVLLTLSSVTFLAPGRTGCPARTPGCAETSPAGPGR